MASREAMNMGSRSSTVISELKSVISLLGQTADSAYQKVSSSASKLYSTGGAPSVSSNLVAPNPVFNAPAISYMTETGSGVVASGPSGAVIARGAGTNLTEYSAQSGAATLYQPEVGAVARGGGGGGGSFGGGGNTGGTGSSSSGGQGFGNILKAGIGSAVSSAYAIYNVAANLTPNTSDALEAQLLQQRASFYTGGGKTGIGAVQTSQQSLANLAMLSGDNPQMDVMRAQIAAQGYGLGSSVNTLLKSAANVSNLMPGLGVEGAIRATGAMQQGYNVNMLRGIGIQLRDPVTGQLKGPDEVIDQVWQKICRDYGQAYGSGKSPSLNEIQISLQPGNALDSMLNQYFGNDPMLKQLVANGLIYKAQGGGAITKGGVAGLGGTTEAMLSYTSTAAAGQGFLTAAEGGAATGFIGANAVVSKYYTDAANGLVQVLSNIKSFTDTVLTAFGGNPVSAMVGVTGASAISGFVNTIKTMMDFIQSPGDGLKGILTSLFANTSFMAEGGPVSGNTPYIVGEKGPELFVPNSNGTIIPNDQLNAGSTYNYNFTINAASGNTQDLVTEIKSVLVQLETNRKVSES